MTHLRNTLAASAILVAALTLAACDRPTVVNVPATPAPVAVPGPAGAAGPAGATGATGNQGATGDTGSSTSVIVMPTASAPASN